METFNDLFEETLKDIYYAEKAILKALPKMAKKASGRNRGCLVVGGTRGAPRVLMGGASHTRG